MLADRLTKIEDLTAVRATFGSVPGFDFCQEMLTVDAEKHEVDDLDALEVLFCYILLHNNAVNGNIRKL